MLISVDEKDGTTSVIYYYPKFFPPNTIQSYLDDIWEWRGDTSSEESTWVPPRLQRWSSLKGENFSKKWGNKYKRWEHIPYDDQMLEFQQCLQESMDKLCPKIGLKSPNINSVLVNKYIDGKSNIHLHQDKLPEFGEDPTIVCCSFGASRTFNLVRTHPRCSEYGMTLNKEEEHLNTTINLGDGDLLIMGGASQRCYAHSISPTDEEVGVRYSCVFREHSIDLGCGWGTRR